MSNKQGTNIEHKSYSPKTVPSGGGSGVEGNYSAPTQQIDVPPPPKK
ncbi:hypothetical protein HBA94_16025 [Ochrobactrum sp. GRS2]|nr:hypothetical protein [Ochrobactrum sp. GRS2]